MPHGTTGLDATFVAVFASFIGGGAQFE